MKGEGWVERACAKINLGLKILGKRPDGYHEICSLVQCVDLADELHFEPADRNILTCSDSSIPTNGDNLVLRAMTLFADELQSEYRPHRVHLEKNVPVGAGLGGGSADAAATLRALNTLHGDPFDAGVLRVLAARLGSDIPFLIEGGTAVMRGRGEDLQPLEWRGDVFYVLVYPNVAVSTAWAYARVKPALTDNNPYLRFVDSLSGGCIDCRDLLEVLENDFLPVVDGAYPIVATLRSHLDQAGANVTSMSGSGSTVYGIFDDRIAALKAQRELRALGYRSFFCQPLVSEQKIQNLG
jgi:4-diphosphocytidyl-2-C-methyl-D-erythritol kinase